VTVLTVGLNHRTAPARILDDVNFSGDRLTKLLAEVSSSDVVSEVVVVATCNRTEIYAHAERFHDAFRDIRHAIGLISGVDPEIFDPHLYHFYNEEADEHLFTVAAGLDSVVVGEHEILGQVGRAWDIAREESVSGPVLNLLFRRAVECGKLVRTDTGIGRSTASLPHAAVSLIGEQNPELEDTTVLLVGAGELGAGVAEAFAGKHSIALVVANRTRSKARAVADGLGGIDIAMDEIQSWLPKIDVLITATAAPGSIFSLDDLANGVSAASPIVAVDLAQPRDLPIGAADIDGLGIIDLAQVQSFANRGLQERKTHVDAAKVVVQTELVRYQEARSAREVAPLIGGLYGWADGVRKSEFERHGNRLQSLSDTERAAVEALTRSIVAKILHQPTVTLKSAAGTPKGGRLADAVRELFDH